MSMQVQTCKDEASTSVKVVTLRTISLSKFRCLSHRDDLDRVTLDLDSRRKGQIFMLQSQRRARQRQYKSVLARVLLHVCMLYIASMHAIYSASLAWDYVSQGNA